MSKVILIVVGCTLALPAFGNGCTQSKRARCAQHVRRTAPVWVEPQVSVPSYVDPRRPWSLIPFTKSGW